MYWQRPEPDPIMSCHVASLARFRPSFVPLCAISALFQSSSAPLCAIIIISIVADSGPILPHYVPSSARLRPSSVPLCAGIGPLPARFQPSSAPIPRLRCDPIMPHYDMFKGVAVFAPNSKLDKLRITIKKTSKLRIIAFQARPPGDI